MAYEDDPIDDPQLFVYRKDLVRMRQWAQTPRDFPDNHVKAGEKLTLGDSATAIRYLLNEHERFKKALEAIVSGSSRQQGIEDAAVARGALDGWAFDR